MTCFSCHYSIWREPCLWCLLKGAEAETRCAEFCFEPGTDESER